MKRGMQETARLRHRQQVASHCHHALDVGVVHHNVRQQSCSLPSYMRFASSLTTRLMFGLFTTM